MVVAQDGNMADAEGPSTRAPAELMSPFDPIKSGPDGTLDIPEERIHSVGAGNGRMSSELSIRLRLDHQEEEPGDDGSLHDGAEYLSHTWPERDDDSDDDDSPTFNPMCDSIAIAMDSIFYPFSAAVEPPQRTKSMQSERPRHSSANYTFQGAMDYTAKSISNVGLSLNETVPSWQMEMEEHDRQRIVRRLVRDVLAKAMETATLEELRRAQDHAVVREGPEVVLGDPVADEQGNAVRHHLVKIAPWEKGRDAELVQSYTSNASYQRCSRLETVETEPIYLNTGGRIRFRSWCCRLKGWHPQDARPRVIILGTYGVLKCMSGIGPTPSEKSIKFKAHQFISNLGAAYYGLDYMGHGPPGQKTPGNGFMVSSSKLRLVMKEVLSIFESQFPGIPVFLHGECYGAMLSLSCVVDKQMASQIAGIIHNGAPLYRRGSTKAEDPISRTAIQVADWLVPPWYAQRFISHEKIGPMPGWFFAEGPATWNDSIKLGDFCLANMEKIFRRVPMLGIYSQRDPLVSTSRMMSVFSDQADSAYWERLGGNPVSMAQKSSLWSGMFPPRKGEPQGAAVHLSAMVCLQGEQEHLIRDSEDSRDFVRKLECTWMEMVMRSLEQPEQQPLEYFKYQTPEVVG